MHIDPELQALAQSDPELQCEVVITIEGYSESMDPVLAESGFEITNRDLLIAGILAGKIRAVDIHKLGSVAGVESVEPDSEQHALG